MNVLTGTNKELYKWALAAGLIHEGEPVYRVVIDWKADDVVKVYIEKEATDQMIKVIPPDFSKAEIIVT